MGIRVAVIGATGYGGAELVRLLALHPSANVTAITSERVAGKAYSEECPWISNELILETSESVLRRASEFDVVFLALESGRAAEHAKELVGKTRIVDLSADHRLKSADEYTRYYNLPWAPLSEMAVYGLPELVPPTSIRDADLVANTGCHVVAALLALMPIVREGLLNGIPVIDSKTGASGAGRAPKSNDFAFSELSGGVTGYATVGHRHTAEIEQMIGSPVRFTPHLVPMARGLEATIYAPLRRLVSRKELHDCFQATYDGRPFVRIVEKQPSTKQVLGSNRCDICVAVDERTHFAVISSVIDNLGKGAAGQAIQNMNLMFGLAETTGLPIDGVWP